MFLSHVRLTFLLCLFCGLFLIQPADLQAQRRKEKREQRRERVSKNVKARHQQVKSNVQSRRDPIALASLNPNKYFPTINKATGNQLFYDPDYLKGAVNIKERPSVALRSSRGLRISKSNSHFNIWTIRKIGLKGLETSQVWYLYYDKADPGQPLKWVESKQKRRYYWKYQTDFEYSGAGGLYYYFYPKGKKNKLAIEEKNGTHQLARFTGRDNQKFKFEIL